MALLQNEVMRFFFSLIDNFLCKLESQGKSTTLTVTFNKDADSSVLNVECYWILRVRDCFSAFNIHDVLPVKQTNV